MLRILVRAPPAARPLTEARVSEQQYEFRVLGRLSEKKRNAFGTMEVTDVPTETIISTKLSDDSEIHAVLALIQSLGLNIISVERVSSE
jgi:hypothetical protein